MTPAQHVSKNRTLCGKEARKKGSKTGGRISLVLYSRNFFSKGVWKAAKFLVLRLTAVHYGQPKENQSIHTLTFTLGQWGSEARSAENKILKIDAKILGKSPFSKQSCKEKEIYDKLLSFFDIYQPLFFSKEKLENGRTMELCIFIWLVVSCEKTSEPLRSSLNSAIYSGNK